jgi:hypothetical protein
VLQQLSEQVRECHRRAADARAQAEATNDPAMKKSYFDLEDRWLFLARSYMFTESLEDFIDRRPQPKKAPRLIANGLWSANYSICCRSPFTFAIQPD